MTPADGIVLGLIVGVSLVASGVFLGVWLGDRRVAQRQRLAALRRPPAAFHDGPPDVCGGGDAYRPEDEADWWKKGA